MCSLWCGSEDDLAPWSSPATTSTPPCCEVPAALPCLNTSPERSTPGPLPYHIANTPSYFAPLNRLTCWLPQTAVAARSSLTPGSKWTWFSRSSSFCAPQRLVERAERRPAIAGDEAGGVQPGFQVALALQHGKLHQRLDAGEVPPSRIEGGRSAERKLGNGIIHWHAPRADVPVYGGDAAPAAADRRGRISPLPGRGWCSHAGKQGAPPRLRPWHGERIGGGMLRKGTRGKLKLIEGTLARAAFARPAAMEIPA